MGRRKKGDKVTGWVNLDKPLNLTSTQAMAKVRRIMNAQKAGHAGTLDPLATGILPIALGEATKTIPFAQDRLKTYEFTITWGEQRSTDDAEGDVIARSEVRPDQDAVNLALAEFTGEIEQIPPKFSAIKVDGQRAYDLARDGQDVELKPRNVYVGSLELLDARSEDADFRMTCGKGTYVRSLARDMAEKLGSCGYISALRRTAVGSLNDHTSISLEKLEEMGDKARDALMPLDAVLDDIPALTLTQEEVSRLRNGQVLSFVSKPDFERIERVGLDIGQIALALFEDDAVALVEREGPNIKPIRVFNI